MCMGTGKKLYAFKTRYALPHVCIHLCTRYTNRQKARRNGFLQVDIPGPFGKPDHFWQPHVVRGRNNFGSEKWSARTNFRVTACSSSNASDGGVVCATCMDQLCKSSAHAYNKLK